MFKPNVVKPDESGWQPRSTVQPQTEQKESDLMAALESLTSDGATTEDLSQWDPDGPDASALNTNVLANSVPANSVLAKSVLAKSVLGGELNPVDNSIDSAVKRSFGEEERAARTEQLINQFHADIFRYAYWLTNCSSSAEDITQETFLRAFRGLHGLRDESAAKSWLMTIARNEFARWCKKTQSTSLPELAESQADENRLQQIEDTEWVARGISQLPDDFRIVVLMFYFEQLSYAEIAEELSVPIGTVMSRLSRGRQQLKKALEALEDPDARKQ